MLKMKKMMMAAVLIGTLGVSGVLTGCGSGISGTRPQGTSVTDDNPQSVSMVMGVHEYFPVISLNTESVYSKIYEACYTYGDFSAVVVDGNPFVACNYSISEPGKRVDSAKRKQLASSNTEQIMADVSTVKGQTPEIDTLSAITLSADTLHSVSGESDKSMIVFDSGLSTTSLLNFSAQNIIDEPAESIVDQLEKLHALPDLTDIEVVWVGLGQTCGEQDALTPNYKYKLQNLWKEILEAGGAASVTFDTSPVSAEEYAIELPKCSTVPIIADSLEIAETVTEDTMPDVIKWDGNSSLQFKGDKAEFLDAAAVKEELEPVAEYLKANPEESIYIFGMTATISGGDDGIDLAAARADSCKAVLMELGADESQMITVGLGQLSNPLRVNDVDADGMQIDELAQKNRAVFVVKSDSDLVDVLLDVVSVAEV